jgi:aryl-alcohol dehydrogenase-like predicted oxidoreductase
MSTAPRILGRTSVKVFPIGLGCASLSGSYGPADEAQALAVIDAAIERGITFFDTSDKYGNGHNEQLLARAFHGRRDHVVIASKFGNVSGKGDGRIADGRPEFVIASCEASLKRLNTDYIDLYYQHRIDPQVPIEETVGAMARLVEQGKVRALGLCEVNPSTLRRAYGVHPISAVQSEYSILYREQAEEILPVMRELGVSFVPYAPLGRGLLTGAVSQATLREGDERLRHPRFASDNLDHNLALVRNLETVAQRHACSAGQVAIAWLLAQGDEIIPIPGTKTLSRMIENTDAAKINLTVEDLSFLAEAFPHGVAAGTRYRAEHMKNMYL